MFEIISTKPHIVWFGENLDAKNIDLANDFAYECDFCIVVGTSMQVAPANQIPFMTKYNTLIYVVDPSNMDFYIDKQRRPFIEHIQDVASTGMQRVKQELLEIINK